MKKSAPDDREAVLTQAALAASKAAYAPYSKFQVGAALFLENGELVSAANVENSSYGLSMCAERAAIFKAVSMGMKRFELLAVAAPGADYVTPCGACRQVMWEFGKDAQVLLVGGKGASVRRCAVRELLPDAFGPEYL